MLDNPATRAGEISLDILKRIGDSLQPITNVDRTVECASCFFKDAVRGFLDRDGYCPGCGVPICSFCGCTDRRGCLHPEYGFPCSWVDVGVCDFCHWEIAEVNFLLVTAGPEHVPMFGERLRPSIVPASNLSNLPEVRRP
jgi:hypothetical protein